MSFAYIRPVFLCKLTPIKAHWRKGSWPFSFERSATFPPQADHILVDLLSSVTARGALLDKAPPQGGRRRGREKSMCGCLSCAPHWGPGLQPRHVLWLGIKLVTFWFTGWCLIHWATPARADRWLMTVKTCVRKKKARFILFASRINSWCLLGAKEKEVSVRITYWDC